MLRIMHAYCAHIVVRARVINAHLARKAAYHIISEIRHQLCGKRATRRCDIRRHQNRQPLPNEHQSTTAASVVCRHRRAAATITNGAFGSGGRRHKKNIRRESNAWRAYIARRRHHRAVTSNSTRGGGDININMAAHRIGQTCDNGGNMPA